MPPINGPQINQPSPQELLRKANPDAAERNFLQSQKPSIFNNGAAPAGPQCQSQKPSIFNESIFNNKAKAPTVEELKQKQANGGELAPAERNLLNSQAQGPEGAKDSQAPGQFPQGSQSPAKSPIEQKTQRTPEQIHARREELHAKEKAGTLTPQEANELKVDNENVAKEKQGQGPSAEGPAGQFKQAQGPQQGGGGNPLAMIGGVLNAASSLIPGLSSITGLLDGLFGGGSGSSTPRVYNEQNIC